MWLASRDFTGNDIACNSIAEYILSIKGNAGLFSNIEDVTVYADMLLNGGVKLFSRSVLDMASKNYTADMSQARGLVFVC